jgi:hypothetical protein
MGNFLNNLPPNTEILGSYEDYMHMEMVFNIKYDFNWAFNRVSPLGDNVGADFDFENFDN